CRIGRARNGWRYSFGEYAASCVGRRDQRAFEVAGSRASPCSSISFAARTYCETCGRRNSDARTCNDRRTTSRSENATGSFAEEHATCESANKRDAAFENGDINSKGRIRTSSADPFGRAGQQGKTIPSRDAEEYRDSGRDTRRIRDRRQ